MFEIKKINNENDFNEITRKEFINFLFVHLDRFGDPAKDIEKCLDYAFSDNPSEGGFALAAFNDNKLVGALILNRTGMSGYIPENILVYVAVDAECRGKGFGKKIVDRCIQEADGNVKLHVEYDNPAKRLYERIGFKSKYAEMRFDKN